MEGNILKKLEKKLKREKKEIEKELRKFEKEEKFSKKWETKFPKFNGEVSLEEKADEVEEYESLKALGEKMEKKLAQINLALEKIEKGNYGICEKCGREIEIERLKIIPEARFCKKCKK